jgi:hypothetical protein
MPTADSGRMVWAVLPPMLSERFAEGLTSMEGSSAALRTVAARIVTERPYRAIVMAKADELESIVFDDETSSWGVWPLWIDREGLELCVAIGIILGCRLKMALKDCEVTDDKTVKEMIDDLIEAKTEREAR